jgi:hypothetical protein
MLVPVAVTVIVVDGARIAVVVAIVLSAIVTASASTPPSTASTISCTRLPPPQPSGAHTRRPRTGLFTHKVGLVVGVVHPTGSLLLLFQASLVAAAFVTHILLIAL